MAPSAPLNPPCSSSSASSPSAASDDDDSSLTNNNNIAIISSSCCCCCCCCSAAGGGSLSPPPLTHTTTTNNNIHHEHEPPAAAAAAHAACCSAAPPPMAMASGSGGGDGGGGGSAAAAPFQQHQHNHHHHHNNSNSNSNVNLMDVDSLFRLRNVNLLLPQAHVLPHPSSLVHPPHPRSDSEALSLIDSLTRLTDQVQAHTLTAILHRNARTEYLTKFGLAGRTDRQTFKSLLPIVSYEDIQPHIQRIANGDTSPILSSSPITEFLTSSGTSAGESKLMPSIHDEFERRCLLYSFLMPIMNQYVADLDKGKGMYFYFVKTETKTAGGVVARPVLTSYYKSHWFTQRPYDPYNVTTSPNETVLCQDSFQSMYCQMLCGLVQRDDVLRMGAVFASGFLRAIRFLQDHWQQLCHDIATGQLSDSITDEPSRRAVHRLLRAYSPLHRRSTADSVAAICSAACSSSWKGVIPLVWPRTKYIDVIVTGAMAQYIPTLDFYSAGLPLVCTMYGSSECYFGVNLYPLCNPSHVSYTLIPNMAYFEFLPVHTRTINVDAAPPLTHHQLPQQQQQQQQQLVDLADVQVGREYELIVTTYAGLYRYRVGDILRVTGFHNAAPQFQFVCRKNVALSIDTDKTDEETLHRAVEAVTSRRLEAARGLNLRLLEYTSFVDSSTIPGHYVLFWELQQQIVDMDGRGIILMNEVNGEGVDELGGRGRQSTESQQLAEVLAECCAGIEENLDAVYRENRTRYGIIGPLEIRVVESGTFDQLMDYALSRGASINQYKAPRVVTSAAIVELMNARVTLSVASRRSPPVSSSSSCATAAD